MTTPDSAAPQGGAEWTIWDAEARMAREGDWRGVAHSISHDILPLIAEGSSSHACQERARMQIKAADRLCAAIAASSPPAQQARVEDALREALEPFVRHGQAAGAFGGDPDPIRFYTDSGYREVPVADFERARAALRPSTDAAPPLNVGDHRGEG